MSQKQLQHFNCYHYTNILTDEDMKDIEKVVPKVDVPMVVSKDIVNKLCKLTIENKNTASYDIDKS